VTGAASSFYCEISVNLLGDIVIYNDKSESILANKPHHICKKIVTLYIIKNLLGVNRTLPNDSSSSPCLPKGLTSLYAQVPIRQYLYHQLQVFDHVTLAV
jgi:hypothetical protein